MSIITFLMLHCVFCMGIIHKLFTKANVNGTGWKLTSTKKKLLNTIVHWMAKTKRAYLAN